MTDYLANCRKTLKRRDKGIEEHRAAVVAAYTEGGHSAYEIAKALNVQTRAVSVMLKTAGVKVQSSRATKSRPKQS